VHKNDRVSDPMLDVVQFGIPYADTLHLRILSHGQLDANDALAG
jgi:hypothetical protein